jgi:hypothetical protein
MSPSVRDSLASVVGTHTPASMLHLKDIGVQICDPLSAINRELQISERVPDEWLDLAPEKAGVLVGNISGRRVAQERGATHLRKLVEEGVELARIEWIGQLPNQIRRPKQASLGIGLGIILLQRNRKPGQLDDTADPVRVDERMIAEALPEAIFERSTCHGPRNASDAPRGREIVFPAWSTTYVPCRSSLQTPRT